MLSSQYFTISYLLAAPLLVCRDVCLQIASFGIVLGGTNRVIHRGNCLIMLIALISLILSPHNHLAFSQPPLVQCQTTIAIVEVVVENLFPGLPTMTMLKGECKKMLQNSRLLSSSLKNLLKRMERTMI